jgi:hypothetical protein
MACLQIAAVARLSYPGLARPMLTSCLVSAVSADELLVLLELASLKVCPFWPVYTPEFVLTGHVDQLLARSYPYALEWGEMV